MTGKVLQSDKQVHLKKVLRDNIEYRSHARWDGQTPPRLCLLYTSDAADE